MPTVYVPHLGNNARMDLTDAKRFGDLHVIFRRELYPDTAQDEMPAAILKAAFDLRNFNSEGDFLCLVGAPVMMTVCALVLGAAGIKTLRVLRFDRAEGAYYPITMQLS